MCNSTYQQRLNIIRHQRIIRHQQLHDDLRASPPSHGGPYARALREILCFQNSAITPDNRTVTFRCIAGLIVGITPSSDFYKKGNMQDTQGISLFDHDEFHCVTKQYPHSNIRRGNAVENIPRQQTIIYGKPHSTRSQEHNNAKEQEMVRKHTRWKCGPPGR